MLGHAFLLREWRRMPAGPAPASSVVLLQAWVFFAVPHSQFFSTQEITCGTGFAGSMSLPTKESGWTLMHVQMQAVCNRSLAVSAGSGRPEHAMYSQTSWRNRAAPRHTGLYYRMCMFPRTCQNAASAMQALLGCERSGQQTHAHATHASEHPCPMLSTPPAGQLLAATICPARRVSPPTTVLTV